MPKVWAADSAGLPSGHPARGREPYVHPRLEGSRFALPHHIAARCGAKLGAIKLLARTCENCMNCSDFVDGHIIDPYGYLPSDYAIAQGADTDIVDELFQLEANVLPDGGAPYQSGGYYCPLDMERRQMFALNEPERRRRRQAEPGGSRSTKRPRRF